jgi:hypothetical protein
MHPKTMTSPATVSPAKVAVVGVLWVCLKRTGVLVSLDEHAQPFGARSPLPIVTVTEHAPVTPAAKVPAVDDPEGRAAEHPDSK